MAKFGSKGLARGIRGAGSAIAQAIKEDNERERRDLLQQRQASLSQAQNLINQGVIVSPEQLRISLFGKVPDSDIKALELELSLRQDARTRKTQSVDRAIQSLIPQPDNIATQEEQKAEVLNLFQQADIPLSQAGGLRKFVSGQTDEGEILDKITKIISLNKFADENPKVKEAFSNEPSLKGLMFELEPKPKEINPETERRLEQTRKAHGST